MNPQQKTPFQPISSAPGTVRQATPTAIPPAGAANPTRSAAADVIRGQIDQILGTDESPNQTITLSAQADSSSQPQSQNQPSSQPMSNPALTLPNLAPDYAEFENDNHSEDDKIASAAATIAAKQAEESAVAEAHRRYHNAWQQYYQKYYEQYYMAALENQRTKFAAGQASAKTADGTISQKTAVAELKNDLLSKIKRGATTVRRSRHFIPAICGLVVILVAVFIQFNGLLFAQVSAFISPGDTTSQNIIVGTGADQPIDASPRLIIPKINVTAPVVYGLTDLSEGSSQSALENGVIHYPIQGASAFPGQNGNTVILGHSSADWFEPGNYKFIFVQLNRLAAGDLFYLDYSSVRYTYRVKNSAVINPDQVGDLAIGTDKPYATLITCDPPGTALRRLAVFAEQISPDPSSATDQNKNDVGTTVEGNIAGNPPTLFEKIFGGK
jgi:sortase A